MFWLKNYFILFFPNCTSCLSHNSKNMSCVSASECLFYYQADPANSLVHFRDLQRDDVATQFGQMTLSRQSSGETPEPPSGPVYPSSLMPQPAQQHSYVIASTGQQLPTGGFSGSGPPISQQVLQPPASPQGFVQQPPPAQVGVLPHACDLQLISHAF